mmetsp:Transcript_14857/g.42102  ORF Transcript_14857/g.42102 Transcript_14857/m.42102 type:complete len:201 (-) Transcript_14857:710-1312(-)
MKRRKQKQCKAAVASFLFSAPTNCPLLLQDWLRQIAVDVLRLAAAAVGIGQLDSIKNSLEVFAHVAPVVNDLCLPQNFLLSFSQQFLLWHERLHRSGHLRLPGSRQIRGNRRGRNGGSVGSRARGRWAPRRWLGAADGDDSSGRRRRRSRRCQRSRHVARRHRRQGRQAPLAITLGNASDVRSHGGVPRAFCVGGSNCSR